ncbi:MAG: hypothetical protein AAB867_03370 [Patescibacteria group bacterium]
MDHREDERSEFGEPGRAGSRFRLPRNFVFGLGALGLFLGGVALGALAPNFLRQRRILPHPLPEAKAWLQLRGKRSANSSPVGIERRGGRAACALFVERVGRADTGNCFERDRLDGLAGSERRSGERERVVRAQK